MIGMNWPFVDLLKAVNTNTIKKDCSVILTFGFKRIFKNKKKIDICCQ